MKSLIILLLVISTPLAFANEYPIMVEQSDSYRLTQVDEFTFVLNTYPSEHEYFIEWNIKTIKNHEADSWMLDKEITIVEEEHVEESTPEFGTIALMILAVAIISIIAVSAKSRLNIVPRY